MHSHFWLVVMPEAMPGFSGHASRSLTRLWLGISYAVQARLLVRISALTCAIGRRTAASSTNAISSAVTPGDSAGLHRNGDDSAVAIGGTDYGLANPLP